MPNAALRHWRTVNTRRSHKQQAAATKWGKKCGIPLKPMRMVETMPASSWWTGSRSRDDFDAAAKRELNRMRYSSMGCTLSSPTLEG